MINVGQTWEMLEWLKWLKKEAHMAGKKQPSRQQRSEKMRKDAGLAQVKVYLDETTRELLTLLQESLSEGKMKRDETNMFRSMAVTASIHTLAKARLGEQKVSSLVVSNLGSDSPSDEATAHPHKFLLRTMVNHLYNNSTRSPHRRRLDEVAGVLNESRFRNPRDEKREWSENDISHYVSNDIQLEK